MILTDSIHNKSISIKFDEELLKTSKGFKKIRGIGERRSEWWHNDRGKEQEMKVERSVKGKVNRDAAMNAEGGVEKNKDRRR